jgi:hypothetical protein
MGTYATAKRASSVTVKNSFVNGYLPKYDWEQELDRLNSELIRMGIREVIEDVNRSYFSLTK